MDEGLPRHPAKDAEKCAVWEAWRSKLHVGALIIRIGFWGKRYYDYNTEPK